MTSTPERILLEKDTKHPQNQDAHALHTVVGYSAYRWEHALTTLRIVHPLQQAGLQFIPGNLLSDINLDNVSLADVVVVQREFPDAYEIYEQIAARAHAEGKPLVYEIDDLLLEIPDEHPDRLLDYYTPSLFSILRAVVEADLVTTTTPALQSYLRPFNPNITLLPNTLDDSLWSIRPPRPPVNSQSPKPNPTPVTIGYMGSDTHSPDLQTLLPAFLGLLRRYGQNISFRFWGGEPPAELRVHSNVEHIPLAIASYVDFAAFFSQVEADIFIAPLNDSLFNRCKSPLKYFEYSSQGFPGVYSRIFPYESVITHGKNGLLASTPEEWETCLAQLIDDPPLRYQLALEAQRDVQAHWLLSQHAYKWKEAYQKAAALATRPDQGDLDRQNTRQIFVRAASQVRGWHHKMYRQIILRDQQILDLQAQLVQKDREIQEIQGSTGWKLVQAAWRVRRVLIPPGSRRERLLQDLKSKVIKR
jgi:processive 1,2-diacylglycerol beta-glucosyltransferase